MRLNHIAAIPDGNRRYKEKHGLSFEQAYLKGFQKVEEVLSWAEKENVGEMSFWALSLENFSKRSTLEKKIIFKLMRKEAEEAIRSKKFIEKNVNVVFFGRLELLPSSLVETLKKLEFQTADKDGFRLNIGIAYSGKDEIVQAARSIALDLKNGRVSENDFNDETFRRYLYLPVSPDLIIRTGNVQRLSGFLQYQNAYSELYFSPKLWPEFSREDFKDAVDFFYNTERRFGK
ncbi:di-trans,poly-cis-decaprenylcistransferase [Candidatus Micrarchaeota archaeon]|nr:di-trans,poly-cis-decaprenylcistransferase [Candidatus Micrarchaeota archaeon]